MIAENLAQLLAPTGKLRVGINFGNPVLANRNANGEPHGIAVDLGLELGRQSGLPVVIVPFEAAGKMSDAAKSGVWDVAFLAIDPNRAEDIDFATPYLEIKGAYLVPKSAPFQVNADVDRAGVRIGVSGKSAYDLYLSREIKNAELVRATSPQTSVALILEGKVDVLAGVRQHMEWEAAKNPNWRVLQDSFMTIRQAVGVVKGRGDAVSYLCDFIEGAKASGFVAAAIERSGVDGVTIAPAER